MVARPSVTQAPTLAGSLGSSRQRGLLASAVLLPMSLLAGCTASAGDAGPGVVIGVGGGTSVTAVGGGAGAGAAPSGVGAGGGAPSGGALGPLATPLRHLTRAEYNYSVRALLGEVALPRSQRIADDLQIFAAPTAAFPFAQGVDTLSKADLKSLREAAEQIVTRAAKQPIATATCTAPATDTECAHQFIDNFGRLAYRRPLLAEEGDSLAALYARGRADLKLDHAGAVALVVEGILQSPGFLYARSFGRSSDPYQVASALAFFLWSSGPDATLLDAAQSGQLLTPASVDEHARRLLADKGRSAQALRGFADGWMNLDSLAKATKDPTIYPSFSGALTTSMADETRDFLASVMSGDRSFKTLMTSPATTIDRRLATLYGQDPNSVPAMGTGRVQLDAMQRAGILTQASFLTLSGDPEGSLPPRRGKIMYENILCRVAPPVPNAVPPIQPAKPDQTTRQRFAEHLKADCASCHKVFDPLGFAFEHYDGIGAYRATEKNQLIDASGEITLDGVPFHFQNAVELLGQFAQSPEVARCFASKWLSFALQRPTTDADLALLDRVAKSFSDKQLDIGELLASIAANSLTLQP